MHKELKSAVKALEDQLKSQQEVIFSYKSFQLKWLTICFRNKGTRIAIETAEKSYYQIAQADEKEFQLKCN